MKKPDDVNAPLIALVGIVSAILLFIITIGAQAWIRSFQERENYRKVVSPRDEKLARLEATQMESINAYRMVDTQKGVVAIPIDRAMEIVVKDLATTGTRTQGSDSHVAKQDE